MNYKKYLLPLAAGALALGLTACSEEDKSAKEESPKEEVAQEETKAPSEKDAKAAAKEMEANLAKQQVDEKEIVAIVNKEELTGAQYNEALASIQGQMQQMGQDPNSKEAAEQLKTQTIDSLVNQTLILQKAEEAKITASEKEVEERYATFEEQFGGEEAMTKALKEQNMELGKLKEQIAQSIVFEKYQDKVVPAAEVTDEEIQAYYDQAAAQSKEAGQELPPLEEASKEIKGVLEQQQQQEKFAAHVEEIKADAEIDVKI